MLTNVWFGLLPQVFRSKAWASPSFVASPFLKMTPFDHSLLFCQLPQSRNPARSLHSALTVSSETHSCAQPYRAMPHVFERCSKTSHSAFLGRKWTFRCPGTAACTQSWRHRFGCMMGTPSAGKSAGFGFRPRFGIQWQTWKDSYQLIDISVYHIRMHIIANTHPVVFLHLEPQLL